MLRPLPLVHLFLLAAYQAHALRGVSIAVRAPLCKVGTMGSSPVRPQRTWPVPGRNYRRVGEVTKKERKKWIDKHGQRKVTAAAEIRR